MDIVYYFHELSPLNKYLRAIKSFEIFMAHSKSSKIY